MTLYDRVSRTLNQYDYSQELQKYFFNQEDKWQLVEDLEGRGFENLLELEPKEVAAKIVSCLADHSIEWKSVEHYGGMEQGTSAYTVYRFSSMIDPQEECYIKFDGSYYSYDGYYYEGFYEVTPRVISKTIYDRKK